MTKRERIGDFTIVANPDCPVAKIRIVVATAIFELIDVITDFSAVGVRRDERVADLAIQETIRVFAAVGTGSTGDGVDELQAAIDAANLEWSDNRE